jgi:HK97 family phage prohead protease
MMRFTSSTFSVDAAQDGTPKRTITGIALPYNVEATVSGGQVVSFLPGSLPTDGKAPKLYMSHDSTQAIGLVTERADSPEAMYFTAKVSTTALGDEALILASDGVLDSVSVGVNPTQFTYSEDGVMIVEAADWMELSLVPQPAFSGATITDVAASIPTSEDEISNNTNTAPDEPETTEPSENPVSETPAPEVIEAAAPLFATVKREPRLPSAGEFVAAMHKGGVIAAAAQQVFAEYRKYHQSPIEAAAGDNVLSNDAGIVPTPILGPVFADINYIAPVLSALGTRAMPNNGNGATFIRPTWTTHPTVAQQSSELSAVSATTAVIASNTVTKVTFAGQAQLSYQVLDFTDPNAMQIIVQDLAGQYLDAIDNYAADNLLTAATSAGVWDLSVADLMKSIYDAAVVSSAATNMLPTHIFVDPATWALMGQLVDTTNRPIFPAIGAPGLQGMNSLGAGQATSWSGMNPLGLQIVVDKNFAAKTMVIMNQNAFEIYRQDRGMLSVEVPSTLGRQMSVFGYAATFKANANMIQKITQA